MNDELNNMRHPSRLRIFWVIVYISIIAIIVAVAGVSASQLRTHIIPTGTIQLSVPYSKYVVGETVSFSIKNNYNSSIYVINKCPQEPLAVYRQENNKWVRQHDYALEENCPEEQRQVITVAGGTVNGNFAAWPNLFLKPGKYRIVAFVEYYNALPYQDIEVIAGTSKTNMTSQQTPVTSSSGIDTSAKTLQTNTTTDSEVEYDD